VIAEKEEEFLHKFRI